MKRVFFILLILCSIVFLTGASKGAEKKLKEKQSRSNKDNPQDLTLGEIKSLYETPMLTSPTDSSVSITILFESSKEFYVRYGLKGEGLINKTELYNAKKDKPLRVELTGLEPGSSYEYTISSEDKIYSFNTAKDRGTPYRFIVEADPHFDERSGEEPYRDILTNMSTLDADFVVDLGDVSMAEKLTKSREEVLRRFKLVRSYWDDVGSMAPFFMVLGNHDGEASWNKEAYVPELRRELIPNPKPTENGFYSGLSDFIYSWEWGDASFFVLNPFVELDKKPKDSNWEWSLGEEQYNWFKAELEACDSKYKFVFIHHLVGGVDKDNRGGSEAAKYYEWGGLDSDGANLFEEMREGWDAPIHKILVDNHVSAVFHGHDHFYAKEELDGIIYQLVPQPALDATQRVSKVSGDYGYVEGVYIASPGFISLDINEDRALVELRSRKIGEVLDSYTIKPY